MRILGRLRSILLDEQEWCFESSDPPEAVVERFRADIQDLGQMEKFGLFSQGWRALPQLNGIFGHVSAERLQLVIDRTGPLPAWLALLFVLPAPVVILFFPSSLILAWGLFPVSFSFDGCIERRSEGCAVSGNCRRGGAARYARYAVIFFLAIGVAVVMYFYATVLTDPDVQFRVLGKWSEMDWPLKAVRVFVLAVPMVLFWLLYRLLRLGADFELFEREHLYEFIRRKVHALPSR